MKLYHLGASPPRTFISWDAVVHGIITNCESTVNASTAANTTICEATLQCILSNVDAHTSARWSAGASILAFIPTITALMSNGISDVLLVAEESTLLAVAMAVCSSTLFASRFGSEVLEVQTADGMFELIEVQVRKAFAAGTLSTGQKHVDRRWRALFGCLALMLSFSAGVWYAASVIWMQGVVVYSCPWRIHVPIWIGLTQVIVLVNVASLRWQFRVAERIDLQEVSTPAVTNASLKQEAKQTKPWPRYIVLRHKQDTFTAHCAAGITTVLTFSNLAFATTVLGGMTMFTASEAVWCMAILAAAAGVSRIVGKWVIDGFAGHRQTAVFNVQQRHEDVLAARIGDLVRDIRQSLV